MTIYDHPHIPQKTGAGNGGSNGLYLAVKGCPVSFRFDSAAEAYEIAGAILAGLHTEIKAELERSNGAVGGPDADGEAFGLPG